MDMAPSRQQSPDPSIASMSTKRWRNGIDLETADNDEIEGFIEWRIKVYKRKEWRGKDLWEVFEEDFEGFKKETFQGGGRDATRELRDCLRAKGVYIPKDIKLITANLELALNEYQEWPADNKEGPVQDLITPSQQPYLPQTLPTFAAPDERERTLRLSPEEGEPMNEYQEWPADDKEGPVQELITLSQQPYLPQTLPTFAAPDEREGTLRLSPEEGEPSVQPALARTVPQARDTRRYGYGKELTMLLKIHGEEHKYNGENDNFDCHYSVVKLLHTDSLVFSQHGWI